MALTATEIEILRGAKREGLSKEQALAKMTSFRQQSPQSTSTASRFSDAGSDLKEGFLGVGDDLYQRGENIADTVKAGAQNKQSVWETGLQTVGQVLGGAGDVAYRAVSTPIKAMMSQDTEDRIAETASSAINATGLPEYRENLTERGQRNFDASLGFLELAGAKGVSPAVKSSLKGADDVLSAARNAVPKAPTVTDVRSALRDVRFNLSDIDPQAETAIKRATFDEINRYAQYAKNAKLDSKKATPLEIVGSKAEEAYELFDASITKATEAKKRLISETGSSTLAPETLSTIKTSIADTLRDRFGVTQTEDGFQIVEGRAGRLDTADERLLSEFTTRLNSLGEAPTLQQVDDFIDGMQSQLYKQSKTVSRLDAADSKVVGTLKGLTGEINGALKESVGNGYAEINARISKLLDLQDEISRGLGADGRKGGGFVKRLFSPTGGNTRRIFEEIRKETGIDLDKEANLARFFMDNVGDNRQKSLLKELDNSIKDFSKFSFTEPASWANWLRERVDLDAQELANEIVRRINDSTTSR
ncbi:hypothetical protein ACMA5I_10310 [Paracoccaceae bacterium GXU_MW_L88]